jgi:BioD-like phosphotransacetylase family protein
MDLIRRADMPVISVSDDTFTAATRISGLMVKIRPGDTNKIHAAEQLVSRYVDIDRMLGILAE